jgi:hypothetical protein
LIQNPLFQALEVNEPNRTSTFTGNNQGVGCIIFVGPANSALNNFFRVINILLPFDLKSFSQLLVVQLSFRGTDFVTLEVLHSKSHSSNFNGIKLLNFIIIFS